VRTPAQLDIENLFDFFLIKIREEGVTHSFAMYPGVDTLDLQTLCNILSRVTIYTFNGINYDLPILVLALHGATQRDLKEANDRIIVQGMKWWDFYRFYGILGVPDYIDHVDLFDVAPGVSIGLKMYMGRIHAPKMQDIPVPFDSPISPIERFQVSSYCDNDLHGSMLLRDELKDRLALRVAISQQYNIDVRSKSDAQIAEAVIKASLPFVPDRRYIPHGFTFFYDAPDYIQYVTPQLQELLQIAQSAAFVVSDREEAVALGVAGAQATWKLDIDTGEHFLVEAPKIRTGVQIPKELKGRNIHIGNSIYRIGIGGLHSQESSVNYRAIPGVQSIMDVDVQSYYPRLITSIGMYPAQIGPDFQRVYRAVIDRRLQAKEDAKKLYDLGFLEDANKAQTESDGLKIVGNGTFGKFFSKYSILYAPELGIAVTLTGQLALLMLIEMMELSGIRVVSANTDGIVLLIPEGYEWIARSNVEWWQKRTHLQMEETHYQSIYMRDVNNYVAITTNGKVKRKGVFAPGGLLSGPQGKHPDKDICADAVVAYLQHGTPLETTIMECRDIRKFLQIRHCKKGAIDLPEGIAINDGKYLGKAVRWYYNGRPGYIGVKDTGDKVAGSQGATPLMELPPYFPADINYQHYVQVARDMLTDLGVKL
jgi:hypothetical protein